MELEGAFFDTTCFEPTNKILGEGQFGKVYVVRNVNDDKEYAAKIIKTNGMLNGQQQMILMRETIILRKLNHPSIVKFYGINFHSFDDPTKLEPTIVTEYLSHGSLKGVLDKEKLSMAIDGWTSTKKYITLLGIAHAMKYMHQHGIIHRDLKPENILIDDDFYPRICDFGLSRCFSEILTNSIQLKMTNKIGTPLYMAPELFTDDQDNQYGSSVDVYAFAMLSYEIVTGKVPFEENGKHLSLSNLFKKVLSGERPIFNEFATQKMQDLISQCWNADPKERPSFDEIFQRLSEDFSYFDEDIDEDEVNNYLDSLNESNDDQEDRKEVKIKKLEDENELLKQKVLQLEEENKKNSQINEETVDHIMPYITEKYKKIENIVDDKELFDYLIDYCQKKNCMEYVLFYNDAKSYKQITDPIKRTQKFIEMRYNYIKEGAPLRISIPLSALQNVEKANEKDPPIGVFNEIIQSCYNFLMTEILSSFKNSPGYQKIIRKKASDPSVLLGYIKKLEDENKKLDQPIVMKYNEKELETEIFEKYNKVEKILEDPESYEVFLYFGQKRLCEECILFYREVKNYKQKYDQNERKQCFISICNNYVDINSPFHIEVPTEIFKKIESADENNPPPDVFDEMLCRCIFIIKTEIYPSFKRSPDFKKFLDKKVEESKKKYTANDILRLLEENKELEEKNEQLELKIATYESKSNVLHKKMKTKK